MEDDDVVNSVASSAKFHVDKALEDWRVVTNMAEPSLNSLMVRKVFQKRQKKDPQRADTFRPRLLRFRSRSRDLHRREGRNPNFLRAL